MPTVAPSPAPPNLFPTLTLTLTHTARYYALTLAKSLMSEDELRSAIAFQRKLERMEAAGEEMSTVEAATEPEGGAFSALFASSSHKPNLLNTVVFLVETAQQVSL